MATINYAKEWKRIADRLEWTMIRLTNQLAACQADDERGEIKAKLENVHAQLERARVETARLTVINDKVSSLR